MLGGIAAALLGAGGGLWALDRWLAHGWMDYQPHCLIEGRREARLVGRVRPGFPGQEGSRLFRRHPLDGRAQFRAYHLLFDIDIPYNVTFKYSWPWLQEAGISGCGDCCEGMRLAVMEPGARIRRGFVPLPFLLVPWDMRSRLHGHYQRRAGHFWSVPTTLGPLAPDKPRERREAELE